ncbi:hypothetical protein Tco_0077514 [Tanacetum coccineum]
MHNNIMAAGSKIVHDAWTRKIFSVAFAFSTIPDTIEYDIEEAETRLYYDNRDQLYFQVSKRDWLEDTDDEIDDKNPRKHITVTWQDSGGLT